MNLGLSGRVALVTGSSRGIGHASAMRLANEGCNVALSGRTRDSLDAAVTRAAHAGVRAIGHCVDLVAPNGAESFVETTVAQLGRLDVVIANVGGSAGGNFMETEPADWLKTFELNALTAIRVIRAAVPHLAKSDEASVVIVASISGSRPGPRAQYGIAKAAEIQLASSLARELAPQRIRVNAVSPGSIMWEGGSWHRRQEAMPERIAEFISREFPWGRMGTLDEVSDVIAFVASPRARWINGANLIVDGAQGTPSITLPPTLPKP